jgi:hypothetical protein
VHLELLAGIVNMKIDSAFGDAQNHSHFPTGLADCRPAQAGEFFGGKRIHASVLRTSMPSLITFI